MGKFYGEIGFAETSETAPGVWQKTITERKYAGDVLKISRRLESSGGVNDDVNLNNEISIIADPYASHHIFSMVYVKWMGAYWKISHVEVQTPRLILRVGGLYNG